jgi:ADP-heptose:LPS heptosyltransferase
MKILIIKPSSLGDVIHSLRVVAQIKKSLPKSKIHWVIKSGLEEILINSQIVDYYYLFHRRSGAVSFLKLLQNIRCQKYDFILDMQGLLRSAIIGFLAKGGEKLGRADGREGSTLFYKAVADQSRGKSLHAIDRLSPFLKELGVNRYEENLPLSFNLQEKSLFVNATKQILLFPESRRKEKVWPYFTELAKGLSSQTNNEIVIAGNEKCKGFGKCTDLRQALSIGQLPGLIKSAQIVICNDSAPLHIASAVGAKVVGLFGPTDSSKYGPYPKGQETSMVLQSHDGKMGSISLDQVMQGVNYLMNLE